MAGLGWAWAFLAVLGLYLLAWLAAPMKELGPLGDDGELLRRFELLIVKGLYPDDLLPLWFGGFTFAGVLARVPIVGLAALLIAGATGWGWLALRALPRIDWLTRAERGVIAATVGLSLLSLATLLLAWLAPPGAQTMALWLLIFVGMGGAGVLLWRDRRAANFEAAPQAPFWNRIDVLLAPLALIVVLGGLLPPTDFDVREYHLQGPKEFLQLGRVEFLPHNVYANMPLGAEMYSLAAMRMTGDWRLGALAGKLVLASFALLTALALKAAGQRWAGPWAGSAAAILYLSTPWVLGVSLNGLIEAVFAHYLFMAVALALAAGAYTTGAKQRYTLLALAGFCGGAAAATKYPGLLYAVALPAAGLLALSRERRWTSALLFLVAAGAGCGPWCVKNLALAGNPTYPLLYDWFDGGQRTSEDNARWEEAHDPPNYSPADLPSRLLDFGGRSDFHSPLLIPLAAAALFDRARRRAWLVLALYAGAVLACWWLLTHRIDRFWVPVLPVVALMAGLGTAWLVPRLKPPLVAGLLVGAVLWGCLMAAGGVMAYDRLFADLDACWSDPQRVPEWIARLNRETPTGSRVISEGDAAVFDIQSEVIYHTAFDPSPLAELIEGRTPEQIREALTARGVAFVYVNWNEINRYRQPGNYGYDPRITRELFERLVREGALDEPWSEFRDRGVEVYPVRKAGFPTRP